MYLRWENTFVFVVLLLLTVTMSNCSTSQKENTLVYERSDGIAGIEERLHITVDGEAVLTRDGRSGAEERIRFSISDEQLQQLHTLFDNADFIRLRNDYGQPVGADYLQYIVKYEGHTVQAADGRMPNELVPVINRLNRIIKHSMTTNPVIVTRQTKPYTVIPKQRRPQ